MGISAWKRWLTPNSELPLEKRFGWFSATIAVAAVPGSSYGLSSQFLTFCSFLSIFSQVGQEVKDGR